MADTLNIALIGCGGMMGAHTQGYEVLWNHDVRPFRIVATCDVDEGRAQAMADRVEKLQGSRPTPYSDVAAMLSKESGLDSVDICSLHRNHHELSGQCFAAGKHVLIEKPLGMTMAACRLMIRQAQDAGKVLGVAEQYRRSTHERAIHWAVGQGLIGDVRVMFWQDLGESLGTWGWRDFRDQAGAGWLLDGGVHFADLFRYHLGEAETVAAQVRAYTPYRYRDPDKREGRVDVTVEDTSLATITFPNGVMAQWTNFRAAPGHRFGNRVIYGSEGCIDWSSGLHRGGEHLERDAFVQRFMSECPAEEKERLFPHGITNDVATELLDFITCVRTGGTPEVDGVSGMRSEAICFGVLESSVRGGEPVSLRDVESGGRYGEYERDLNEGLGIAN